MFEILKFLFAIAGILIALIITIILLLILFETIKSISNSYKNNKIAKDYIKNAKKIIEKERDD